MTKNKTKSKSKKDKKSKHSRREESSFASIESEALVRYSSNDENTGGYDSANE